MQESEPFIDSQMCACLEWTHSGCGRSTICDWWLVTCAFRRCFWSWKNKNVGIQSLLLLLWYRNIWDETQGSAMTHRICCHSLLLFESCFFTLHWPSPLNNIDQIKFEHWLLYLCSRWWWFPSLIRYMRFLAYDIDREICFCTSRKCIYRFEKPAYRFCTKE